MRLLELKVEAESGWYFIDELGQTGLAEIVPIEYERYRKNPYAEQIEICKNLSAKLDYIETTCVKLGIPIPRAPEQLPQLEEFYFRFIDKRDESESSRHTMLSAVVDKVNEREQRIHAIFDNFDEIKRNGDRIIEQYHVLRVLSKVLPTADVVLRNANEDNHEMKMETFGFFYLCGTIDAKDAFRLQRYIFRVSRENVIFQLFDLDYEGEHMKPPKDLPPKKVFFIVFQAGSSPVLRQKIRDSLKTFQVTLANLPLHYSEIAMNSTHLEEEYRSNQELSDRSLVKLQSSLAFFTDTNESELCFLEECRIRVGKELKIYEELNKFKREDKILSAYMWVPEERVDQLKKKITHIVAHNQNIKAYVFDADYQKIKIVPPTYFKLSELTAPFQEIVDTYGVPRFQEVNPGLVTMVSFPYLFGIMFGDIGHGGLLLAFGYMLIRFSDLWKQKGFMLVNYRFLFFAMGFFACFCGFIYNDFLGIPWKLFPSCFTRVHKRFEREDPECTYWLGFDSVWFQSKQEIGFFNSFKMKLSIIVGVIHMVTGIFMKGVNNLHFGAYVDFIFEFLPQLLFMLCTFGYMCFTIVAKWLIDWGDGSNAPSIISLFINMGYTAPGQNMYGDDQGVFQTQVQQNLFMIAFVCIWVMLLPKPIIMWIKHSRGDHHDHEKPKNVVEMIEHLNDPREKLLGDKPVKSEADLAAANLLPNPHAVMEEQHDVGEIFIHQMIETIEFVLGSISNTASYLRLWALSLAHGQLARVFLDMTVLNQLRTGSPISAVVGFPIFVGATFGVLMCMDLMECFLHTLRLHWVEFQNKFYKGDGYKFVPFNIVANIKDYMDHCRLNLGSQT